MGPHRFQEIKSGDGLLGLFEAGLRRVKKRIHTAYYQARFASLGRHSVVTGPLNVFGGKRIRIGRGVVIEGGVTLKTSGSGAIEIGDGCFIESGARLISEGKLKVGREVTILKGALVTCGEEIALGDRTWVARDCAVGGGHVILEEEVILGPGVLIMDGDHQIDPGTGKINMKAGIRQPVRIKRNAWLGARTVVLKGVTVGKGAVAGAGSVVTKDIPDHLVAVGVPARVLKSTTIGRNSS